MRVENESKLEGWEMNTAFSIWVDRIGSDPTALIASSPSTARTQEESDLPTYTSPTNLEERNRVKKNNQKTAKKEKKTRRAE